MSFLKGLYTQNDFSNLTTDEVLILQKELQLHLEKGTDVRAYLYENMESYEDNQCFRRIVSSKVLVGKTALRWMQFYYAGDFTEEKLIERIESQQVGYNANTIDRWNAESEDRIVCIQKNETYYTIRLMINDGFQKISDGLSTRKEPAKESVIINIDPKNRWLEFRCRKVLMDKSIHVLRNTLKIDNLSSIAITNKYKNIEEFKRNLDNGFRFSNISVPNMDFILSENDKNELVELFKLIDAYIIDRDQNKLIKGLKTLKLEFADIPVIQIILSNIGTLTLDVNEGSDEDMGQSLIYMLTKDYATDSGAYIRFSIDEGKTIHSMRISVKEMSVSFSSSVTEEVIEYVRNKIL